MPSSSSTSASAPAASTSLPRAPRGSNSAANHMRPVHVSAPQPFLGAGRDGDDDDNRFVVASGNQSTTSSERAWQEEYQQWKKAQPSPQGSKSPNHQAGSRRTTSLSTPPPPLPTIVEPKKQRTRSANHQQLKEKLSLAGSFSADSDVSSSQRHLSRAGRGYQQQQQQQLRRAVSPCIDSTLPSSCGNDRDERFRRESDVADPIGDEDEVEDDERDDDRRKMRQIAEDNEEEESPIPEHFVKHIQAAFGGPARSLDPKQKKTQQQQQQLNELRQVDLYRDVLQVDRNATDRDLRIAYFKRGRQVLSSNVDTIKYDRVAKRQFQAISMAYEILTTEELRSYYDAHGLVSTTSGSTQQSQQQRPPSPTAAFEALKQQLRQPTTNSTSLSKPTKPYKGRVATSASYSPPPTPPRSSSPTLRGRTTDPRKVSDSMDAEEEIPAIRRKQSRSLSRGRGGEADDVAEKVVQDRRQGGKGRSRSATRSIRWNEHVEELVYERDPDELLAMRGRGKGGKSQQQQDALGSALSVMLGEPPLAASQRHQQQYPKLRKVKRKVVLEAQQLAQELEALQEHKGSQERQNFVSYFLDDLEASLDGLEASVEDFWRFAIATTASSDESSNRAKESKTPAAAELRGQDANSQSDAADLGRHHDAEDDDGEDHVDPAHDHDTTSIGTEEFAPQQSRSRVSPAPEATDFPPVPTTVTRMDLETTPSLDEEAEQELRSSKILEAFEMSDADSRSSSITSGRARAAEDPALNSDRPSVRERVAVLAAAAGQAAFHKKKPSARLSQMKRHSMPSNAMSNEGDDSDSLYDSLMKPHRRSSSTLEAVPSNHAASTLDDVTKQLFQDLTKPPPSGYEANRELERHSFLNRKIRNKSRSRSCGPSSSKNLTKPSRVDTTLEPFDPFRLDDADARPPQRIYDKGSQYTPPDTTNEDAATAVTVSTMSASETTSNLRERILAKHRATAVAGRHKLPDTTPAPEVKSKQGSSPTAVQAFDDDTFDIMSGFESQDPNVLKLDRTRGSGLSTLTGHASHFTAQQEHAWRHLCATTAKTAPCATTGPPVQPPGIDRSEQPMGSACNAPSAGDDQDLVSQIMVYMQAFTEEVDRVGLSITNMMAAAVAVPEDDVQGVLNVLSQEMDSTK